MASNPNKFQGFLDRQRRSVPPPSSRESVEQSVMSRIMEGHGIRKGVRVRWISAIAAIILCSLVAIMLFRKSDTSVRLRPKESYVEFVLILHDHTCIWLEPIAPAKKENLSHE
jgi:hypothetical protein